MPRTRRRHALCLAALAGAWMAMVAPPAMAQDWPTGQVEAGQRLAETWCARCHQVGSGGAPVGGWTDAPRFAAIAADGKVSRAWLRQFFAQPHWNMLYTDRPAQEQADLAAYILSLKPR